MLTEILMESLLSMDSETLDTVLESCSDEELEIINDVVTEKVGDTSKRILVKGPGNNPVSKAVYNTTRVFNNLKGDSDEVSSLIPNEERSKLLKAANANPDAKYHKQLMSTVKSLGNSGTKSKINEMVNKADRSLAEINRKRGYEYNPFTDSLDRIPGAPTISPEREADLQRKEDEVQAYSRKASNMYNELKYGNSSKMLGQYIKDTRKKIDEINAASPNNSSVSARIGKTLNTNIFDIGKQMTKGAKSATSNATGKVSSAAKKIANKSASGQGAKSKS